MKIHQNTIENTTSLLATVQDAGGAVSAFTWDKLKHMTAAEFLNNLSPNMNMSFTFTKKEENKKHNLTHIKDENLQ